MVAFCATVLWLPEDFVEEELEEEPEEALVEELDEDLEEDIDEDLEEEPTPLELDMGDTSSMRRADSSPILLVERCSHHSGLSLDH